MPTALAHDLARALDPALLMADAGQTPDPWQQDVLRTEAKRLLLLCSRQSGKSTVTAALAFHTALYQAPALVLLLSPSLRQSQELFRKVLDVYRMIDETIPTEQESALRLELTNGSRIVALPGLENTIRGYSGAKLLVIDEASRVADNLYYSVRPMLAVSGGRMVCMSTPFGKRGFFHQEWSEGHGWEKVLITADQCPRISKEFLAEERRTLGEWWF
jgi:phage terminase large subunit-like protein